MLNQKNNKVKLCNVSVSGIDESIFRRYILYVLFQIKEAFSLTVNCNNLTKKIRVRIL